MSASRRTMTDFLVSDAGTIKSWISAAHGPREKAPVVVGLLVKALITLLFCTGFVLAFIALFGQENAIAGVVVLLSVLTFQNVHFGYQNAHAAPAMVVIYCIFAFVPGLIAMLPPVPGALVMFVALSVILVLGCDHVAFQNHIVLVLSFLLLYGYPVSASGYWQRVAALLLGGMWSASILYRKNRGHSTDRGLKDVLLDAVRWSRDSEWRWKLAVTVPVSMLLGQALGLDRPMWIGIAAMSVLSPSSDHRPRKMIERFLGTIVGSILFFVLAAPLHVPAPVLGMIGGFLVGLSTTYRYQTVFNSLGAMSIALALYGPIGSLSARIVDNGFAVLFTLAFVFVLDRLISLAGGSRPARGRHRA